jgi:hypothetical protein
MLAPGSVCEVSRRWRRVSASSSARSGGGECELVASDLEQVVDCADESPLAGDCGEPAPGESAEPEVHFEVPKIGSMVVLRCA